MMMILSSYLNYTRLASSSLDQNSSSSSSFEWNSTRQLAAMNSAFVSPSTSIIDESVLTNNDGGDDGGRIDLSPSLLLSFTVCLVLLITIGLIGNTVVIFALIRTRAHLATTTNAYILNLSIADLLFLIFCVPFQGTVYILNDWPFREFMCKAAHFCQYCTMYGSIWVLTIMSIDRYMAIGHPLKSVEWRSPGQAIRVCCYVWIVSGVISIPWLLLYRTIEVPNRTGTTVTACFDVWPEGTYEYRKWLFLFVFVTGFVAPSIIIFCMSLLVARSMRNAAEEPLLVGSDRRMSSGPSRPRTGSFRPGGGCGGGAAMTISKRRRRVVWLVFGLALTFFLCWLPQNASFMWLNFYGDIVASMQRHYKIYFIIKVGGHILTYVNSSINPIMYSLASGRFRSRLAQALFVRNGGVGGSFSNHRCPTSRLRSTTLKNNNSGAANGGGAPPTDSRSASFRNSGAATSMANGGGGVAAASPTRPTIIHPNPDDIGDTDRRLIQTAAKPPRSSTNQLGVWSSTSRLDTRLLSESNSCCGASGGGGLELSSIDLEHRLLPIPSAAAASRRNRALTWSTITTAFYSGSTSSGDESIYCDSYKQKAKKSFS